MHARSASVVASVVASVASVASVVGVAAVLGTACNPLDGYDRGSAALSQADVDGAYALSVFVRGPENSGEGVGAATMQIDDDEPLPITATFDAASPNDGLPYLLGQKTPRLEGSAPVTGREPAAATVLIEGGGGHLTFTVPDLRTRRVPSVVSGEQRDGALVAGGTYVMRWPADSDTVGSIRVTAGDTEVDAAFDDGSRELTFTLPEGIEGSVKFAATFALAIDGDVTGAECRFDEPLVCQSRTFETIDLVR